MPSSERPVVPACPVCLGTVFVPIPSLGAFRVCRCAGCGLQFSNPQPSDAELAAIYGPDYFLSAGDEESAVHVERLKQATASRYCDVIASFSPVAGRRLLEIGCGHGDFLVVAGARGYSCTGIEYSPHACKIARAKTDSKTTIVCGELSVLDGQTSQFDVCVMCDAIEHVRHPRNVLHQVFDLLAPGGLVFIATPSLDSWTARLMRSRWMEYKAEHLTYFSRATLRQLLDSCGFECCAHRRGFKMLSLGYVAAHFQRFPVSGLSPLLNVACKVIPGRVRRQLWPVVASGIITLGRKPGSPPHGTDSITRQSRGS